MKHGFLRVAAATAVIRVADAEYNCEQMMKEFDRASDAKCKIIVFPELGICGYTCGDLFLQDTLLDGCKEALGTFVEHTRGKDCLAFVGLPWEHCGKLYNVAAAVQNGRLLALIPKSNIPNYSEFYEARYFEPGNKYAVPVDFTDK